MPQKSCPVQQKRLVLPQNEHLSALQSDARAAWGDRVEEIENEYPETPWFVIDIDDGHVVIEVVEGFVQVKQDFTFIARVRVGDGCVEKLWPMVSHYVEAQLESV